MTPNLLLPALPFHASLDELHLAGSKAPEFLYWLVPRGYKAFLGTNGKQDPKSHGDSCIPKAERQRNGRIIWSEIKILIGKPSLRRVNMIQSKPDLYLGIWEREGKKSSHFSPPKPNYSSQSSFGSAAKLLNSFSGEKRSNKHPAFHGFCVS